MDLHHRFTVPATVDTTWDTLMDLAGVATCFPGATVTSVEGDTFAGTCKVKLGPIALMYAGSGQFVSRDDDAHHAVIKATGKDKRGNGTAGATVTLSLEEEGGSTAVDVTTDLNVTGKPAQFGRGVMQDVSDKLLQQFVGCLEQRLDTPAEPPAEPSVDAAVGSEAAPPPAEAPAPAAAPPPPAPPSPPAPAARPAPPSNADRPAFVSASAGGNDDAIDLGATVLPVILRSYAPHLAAAAIGLVVGILIGRRRR